MPNKQTGFVDSTRQTGRENEPIFELSAHSPTQLTGLTTLLEPAIPVAPLNFPRISGTFAPHYVALIYMDVKLPPLGEGADSGTVVNLFVKEGDQIAKDQPILELENEKAVATIPSTAAGTIAKIFVKAGDKLSVGQKILSVDGAAGAAPAAAKPADEAPKPKAKQLRLSLNRNLRRKKFQPRLASLSRNRMRRSPLRPRSASWRVIWESIWPAFAALPAVGA